MAVIALEALSRHEMTIHLQIRKTGLRSGSIGILRGRRHIAIDDITVFEQEKSILYVPLC